MNYAKKIILGDQNTGHYCTITSKHNQLNKSDFNQHVCITKLYHVLSSFFGTNIIGQKRDNNNMMNKMLCSIQENFVF